MSLAAPAPSAVPDASSPRRGNARLRHRQTERKGAPRGRSRRLAASLGRRSGGRGRAPAKDVPAIGTPFLARLVRPRVELSVTTRRVRTLRRLHGDSPTEDESALGTPLVARLVRAGVELAVTTPGVRAFRSGRHRSSSDRPDRTDFPESYHCPRRHPVPVPEPASAAAPPRLDASAFVLLRQGFGRLRRDQSPRRPGRRTESFRRSVRTTLRREPRPPSL